MDRRAFIAAITGGLLAEAKALAQTRTAARSAEARTVAKKRK
jgi:hypothetical protein